MKQLIMLCTAFFLFIEDASGAEDKTENSSYWRLCDMCSSDDDYYLAALSTPRFGRHVFVSNRQSGITRKFDRGYTLERSEGELIETTSVEEVAVRKEVLDVFQRALQNAALIELEITRESLSQQRADLENAVSLIVDFQRRSLGAFYTAIPNLMANMGVFPDPQFLNENADLDFPLVGITGFERGVREGPFSLIINYLDGSKLVTMMFPDGSFRHWAALDKNGSVMLLKGKEAYEVEIDEVHIDSSYQFGPGQNVEEAARYLSEIWNRTPEGRECSVDTDAEGIVIFTCIYEELTPGY